MSHWKRAIFLSCVWSLLGLACFSQTAGPDAAGSEVKFTGEVTRGKPFEFDIGHGLLFRLALSRGGPDTGWDILIVPQPAPGVQPAADPGAEPTEYSSIATPPYHFKNPRYIETVYGITAEDAVHNTPRKFQFVESAEDSKTATSAMEAVIFNSGGDLGPVFASTEKVHVGTGELEILDSKTALSKGRGDLGTIEWMKFQVSLRFNSGVTLKDVLFPGSSGPVDNP